MDKTTRYVMLPPGLSLGPAAVKAYALALSRRDRDNRVMLSAGEVRDALGVTLRIGSYALTQLARQGVLKRLDESRGPVPALYQIQYVPTEADALAFFAAIRPSDDLLMAS